MITFDRVSITYPDASAPVLRDVDLHVPEGELVLVVGRTGSGKSTLLGAVNGLVPHFTGGTLTGRVTVGGRDTATHPPRELADLVGVVPQDPMSAFVTDVVEDELAYGMESLGVAPAVMRRRVEETLDLLGLADLRDRPLLSLSGGQRQRVAIGAVLTSHPRVLVLDEPTSALDPGAAEEVLAALQRLVHDLGMTVLLAEHRLERVVQYADRVVVVPGGGAPLVVGDPEAVMRDAPVAPPVVQLGRLLGWTPLPLSVRDARRAAGDLRAALADAVAPAAADPDPGSVPGEAPAAGPVAATDRLVVRYGDLVALREASLDVRAGEVVAVMGRNGAGKSTLLSALVGLRRPSSGRVSVGGREPASLSGPELVRSVGLVPQDPTDLLYADRVAEECRAADRDAGVPTGTTRALLALLAPEVDDDQHPRDLSEGQRLALALSVVLAGEPPLLLLDEPTRGLDYSAKSRLVDALRALATRGHAVVLATHDVELVAEVATRVVVLAEGEVVADGATAEVVVSSPMFAPQVAKVLAPEPWLTVSAVADALAGTR
ncbi:MAG: ATP-binding cassette domain-containing protein [Candidatus Nanopelagicales bacterium]